MIISHVPEATQLCSYGRADTEVCSDGRVDSRNSDLSASITRETLGPKP